MKSFFGIYVLSALAAVGNTQPTHNSPHHTRPDHHMSQQEDPMSQPQQHIVHEPHFRQPNHYNNQPQQGYDSWSAAEAQALAHSQTTWISPESSYQPGEILSKPQHGYDSWSTAEAQAQAHSRGTWTPSERPYEPVEILSEPHHINQPHIIHPQSQPIDPQFEFNPYPYQHPHYPPTGSHHTQDTGPPHPAHGWNTQNPPVVYQHQLPEETAPEHHINTNNEDYPNHSFAVASAVATASSNSVHDADHEPAHSPLYKMISIPKADNGANYNMPVADHETKRPNVILTSNDEGLPDVVQEILAKYRHIPIEINPKPEINVPSKEHLSESPGPVHRPHKHKKHKVPTTIPVVTKQSTKAKAVAVANTGTDKRYTYISGGKHSTVTKAPAKHKHKHSHKKVLKPLLDPELLAKELDLLSRQLWVPSPDKTHEKDIPCDDNPISYDDRTNSEEADGSKSPDKIKLKDKPKDKHRHLHESVDTPPETDISKITTTPSSHIEPNDKKHADENTDFISDCLGKAPEPCNGDEPPEKGDKINEHDPKPIINEKPNINSKPKIEINDFKEEKVVQKKEFKKEVTEKIETKEEKKIEHFAKKQHEGKLNQKKGQNPDETTEPCDNDNDPKPIINEKPNINSKPKIEINDFKEEKVVQKKEFKKEVTEKIETKEEKKIEHFAKKQHEGKLNQKKDQNPDETTEPCDNDNDPKPIINEKPNINSKPKIEINDFKEEKVVQKKEFKKGVTEKIETKEEKKIEHFAKKQHEGKLNQKKDQNPDETTEPCDNDNVLEEEKESKHVPVLKTDDKENNDPDQNKLKNKPTKHHHNKHEQSHAPANIGPEKDKTKEDKTKKQLPKPIIDDTENTATKLVDNKGNTDHKLEQKKEKEKEDVKKAEKKKEEIVHQSEKTKRQPEIYDEKQKPVEKSHKAPVSEKFDSTKGSGNLEPNDKIPTSEYKDKKENSIPHTKKDNIKPQPVNTNKKNDTDPDQSKPKNKPTHHDQHSNDHAHSHTPTNIVPQNHKAKTTKPSTNVKSDDQKDAVMDKHCDPVDSDESTEPHDTISAPEQKDKPKKLLPKPKIDDTKNTASEPVDKKGNLDTIPDHNVLQKKDETKEEIKIDETIKEETVHQSETLIQHPETYDKKQNPVEQDFNAPVSDECDATESSVNQRPYNKMPAQEHKKIIKKPPLKGKKDDYKPVDPDTHKGNKDKIIIAKNDVKKVELTKEVTQKVETKKEDKRKPEKQEDKSSNIEDCNSTESNEPQNLLEKTPEPEYKRKLNKPLPKANHVNKASKDNNIFDKKEETVKVKTKTKKPTKNVVSSDAVDKSKPIETSNENWDVDDCDSVETKTKKPTKNVVSSDAVDQSKPIETSNENSDVDDCDSADSETDPKPVKEKHDPKKKRIEEVNKKKATIGRNKTEGKAAAEELTSDEVAEILEKNETDQPLSTVGFLVSLISHALQGSDSVRQMFEEPKVKAFVKNIIPMFHVKPKI